MQPGTIVRLPDGREATVVYHGLIGYGIVWGRREVNSAAILNSCPLFDREPSDDVPEPEALLRKPFKSAEHECVSDEHEVIN